MRSAWVWAAWCFQSLTYACGRSANSGSSHSGVPSARTGSTVQAVKSVPIPMTSSADDTARREGLRDGRAQD